MAMANNVRLEEWAGFEPGSFRCAHERATCSASIPCVPLRCATTGAAVKLIRESGIEPPFRRTLRRKKDTAAAIAPPRREKED